jgi:glutathione peroxidase
MQPTSGYRACCQHHTNHSLFADSCRRGIACDSPLLRRCMKLTDIPLTTIDGASTSLAEFDGKVKLIVNVASRCGLAPQYEKLEALQKEYGDRGFTVLGFPSNQFLQELGDTEKIKEYCSMTWGVTFPMFEKVRVNGKSQHPLYAELTKTPDADGKAGKVKWNFEKFLVTPDGTIHRFRPTTQPDDPAIVELIESSVSPA